MQWGDSHGPVNARDSADRPGAGAPADSGQTTLSVPTEALPVLRDALLRHYQSAASYGHDRSLTALLLMRVEQALGEGVGDEQS